jgi:hypothetical protein
MKHESTATARPSYVTTKLSSSNIEPLEFVDCNAGRRCARRQGQQGLVWLGDRLSSSSNEDTTDIYRQACQRRMVARVGVATGKSFPNPTSSARKITDSLYPSPSPALPSRSPLSVALPRRNNNKGRRSEAAGLSDNVQAPRKGPRPGWRRSTRCCCFQRQQCSTADDGRRCAPPNGQPAE